VDQTEQGADDHIDQLAKVYLGVDSYPYHREGDIRVMFRIQPMRVATMNTTMPQFGEVTG
jgi:hypothetical protein